MLINILSTILTGTMIIGTAFTPIYANQAMRTTQFVQANEAEAQCLALNVYYEARSSNLADKAGVADVVLNRVADRRYPDTICDVVQDGYKSGRKDCQFSWYCDGKPDVPVDLDRWFEAQTVAYNMIEFKEYRGISEGATHYHATYVNPFWASSLRMVGRIGEHIYYRWE